MKIFGLKFGEKSSEVFNFRRNKLIKKNNK